MSGFLITGILLRARKETETGIATRGFALRQFYMRRFLRIFPLYYLALLVAWIASMPCNGDMLPWNLLYLSNVYIVRQGAWPGPMSHLWSLSVEEQFYLVWPWLVLFLPRKAMGPVIASLIVVGVVTKFLMFHFTCTQVGFVTPTICCLDALGAGSLLALLSEPGTGREESRRLMCRVGLIGGVVMMCIALFVYNTDSSRKAVVMAGRRRHP